MPLGIALLLLLAVVGTLGYLFWRRGQLGVEFQRFLEKRALRSLPACPPAVERPFVYERLLDCTAYEGRLSGEPLVLILGSRQREGAIGPGQKVVVDRYVGAYLPGPRKSALSDEWLLAWQRKVAERGDGWAKHSGQAATQREHGLLGPPESLPIRAVRTSDGGALIAWQCLHLGDRIEQRLAELEQSLPR